MPEHVLKKFRAVDYMAFSSLSTNLFTENNSTYHSAIEKMVVPWSQLQGVKISIKQNSE